MGNGEKYAGVVVLLMLAVFAVVFIFGKDKKTLWDLDGVVVNKYEQTEDIEVKDATVQRTKYFISIQVGDIYIEDYIVSEEFYNSIAVNELISVSINVDSKRDNEFVGVQNVKKKLVSGGGVGGGSR